MFVRIQIVALLAPLVILGADDKEKKVQMKDLPEAVQKTVREQTKTAKLKGLAQEVENGKTFYEAETILNGKSRDILIDTPGAIVEVEEATTMDQVPTAAQESLKKAAGAGKILSVEKLTKGSEIGYEAAVSKGGKKAEVAVNADGTPRKE